MKALGAVETYIQASGLEQSVIDLVKTRASQINGCAYCIHLHTRDARTRGESEERLYLFNAWRDSPLYTGRERAALAWTEAVTLVAQTHVPDAVYEEVRQHFAEDEVVNLALAVCQRHRQTRGSQEVAQCASKSVTAVFVSYAERIWLI